jgi:hypothetical protein
MKRHRSAYENLCAERKAKITEQLRIETAQREFVLLERPVSFQFSRALTDHCTSAPLLRREDH